MVLHHNQTISTTGEGAYIGKKAKRCDGMQKLRRPFFAEKWWSVLELRRAIAVRAARTRYEVQARVAKEIRLDGTQPSWMISKEIAYYIHQTIPRSLPLLHLPIFEVRGLVFLKTRIPVSFKTPLGPDGLERSSEAPCQRKIRAGNSGP
jgi:hypothetical protein